MDEHTDQVAIEKSRGVGAVRVGAVRTPAGIEDLLIEGNMPHLWCPGCGHGIVLGCLLRAIKDLHLPTEKVVIVSGIGCSSRAVAYVKLDAVHTTHGRAIAFATGIKMTRPEMTVIVISGDGDLAAIGGNHLIHACRRNVDITTICFNNSIYGMTSGQYSPLTPTGDYAATAPYGTIDRPFDLANLAISAGATFVARSTAYHAVHLEKMISMAISHKGFSLVEAITQCPTYYGRRNRYQSVLEMLDTFRRKAVPVEVAENLDKAQRQERLVIGVLHREETPEFSEQYYQLVNRVSRKKRGLG